MFTILIVDDEAETRDGLASLDWQSIRGEIAEKQTPTAWKLLH